ncbi:MAG: exosortase/archaeosortase family protein [Sedimentisphaerales bacterium]|nr:exosortase/archaeosortase family protein [Sedimentisphaerales bacterium]
MVEAKVQTIDPSQRRKRRIDLVWTIIIIGGLYAILFREELLSLWNRWTSDASESHGFLIPAFSLYFLYQDRLRWSQLKAKPSFWGLLLIFGSLFMYAGFFYIGMGYPRQVSILGVLLGTILLLGGWRAFWLSLLPVLFLIFAMPLPARMYYQISMPMRELASAAATMILNVMPNIDWVEATGVVIHGTHLGADGAAEPFSLNVAEACSGMRLLQAFLALGVAMAYLEKRPIAHRVVLVCSTIPIAIFCNMLRVLLTGFIHIYIGADYATGTLHTLLGMAMLVVAFGLYGLLAWLMNNLFVDESETKKQVLVVGQKAAESAASDTQGGNDK